MVIGFVAGDTDTPGPQAALSAPNAARSSGRKTSGNPPTPPFIPFIFFDLDDSFLFLVWIPSFFIVNGRLTYNKK
jgi:hypothetical protein